MKKISKQIELILNKFKIKAEKEILRSNFQKIAEDEHIIRIRVLGEVVDIWNVEGIDVCLYQIVINETYGDFARFRGKTGNFKNPEECRKILVGAK